MNIKDDHLYHGAALIQIAEHPQFTAINSIKTVNAVSRSAYRINDDIAVYLKYASTEPNASGEFVFTFTTEHLNELQALAQGAQKLFIALVVVKGREICVLSYAELQALIGYRTTSKGAPESSYSILLTLKKGSAFRAYVNAAGTKGKFAGKQLIIPRNKFPGYLFS